MRKYALPAFLVLIAASIVLALLGSLGAFGPSGDSAAEFTQPAATATRPAAFPGMAVSYTGSGKFRVPDQAPPGEYAVTSTSGTFGCSWWVLKDNSGKPKAEISAGTMNRAGFDSFTIPANARWLKLLGNCTISGPDASP